MTFRKVGIITSIIVLLLGVAFCILASEVANGLTDGASHYSTSIEESKSNGYFLGHYRPLQDSVSFGKFTFKAEKLWYEKNWTTQHHIISEMEIKVDTGMHFIAPYPSLISKHIYVCIQTNFPNCKGCFYCIEEIKDLGYAHTISNIPDTLVLLFTYASISSPKDTVTYVRED